MLSHAEHHLRPGKRGTLHLVPQGQLAAEEDDTDRMIEPHGAAEPGFTPPAIHRERLANGLELLVVEDHSLPIVQANLVVKSGWAADPADRPGAASLTAELLDEGTTEPRCAGESPARPSGWPRLWPPTASSTAAASTSTCSSATWRRRST